MFVYIPNNAVHQQSSKITGSLADRILPYQTLEKDVDHSPTLKRTCYTQTTDESYELMLMPSLLKVVNNMNAIKLRLISICPFTKFSRAW